MYLHYRWKMGVLWIAPPIIALFGVYKENALFSLGKTHEALLPLSVMILLAALLIPRLRRFLLITLCYVMAFLNIIAYNRLIEEPLPGSLNYTWALTVRILALDGVIFLALLAAALETIRSGAVWARRCYFLSVGLYFGGMGIREYAWDHSIRGVALCITGLAAVVGAVMARDDLEIESETLDDASKQETLLAAHKQALAAKEWRESSNTPDDKTEISS